MLGTGRDRLYHRSLRVVMAATLFLLVGILAIVLVNGSSSLPPASNVAAECTPATGPTARGYGETGAGVAECESSSGRVEEEESSSVRRPPVSPGPRVPSENPAAGLPPVAVPSGPGPGGGGPAGVGPGGGAGAGRPSGGGEGQGGHPCPPGERLPQDSGRPNAREDDETGAGGDTAAAACIPCPPDSRAPGASEGDRDSQDDRSPERDDESVGPTGRGYGESGASGVMSTEAEAGECPAEDQRGEAATAPTTGGGGSHDGRVPGATGRPAPTSTTASDASGTKTLQEPLVAASVGQTASDEGGRRNTALVVGGLVLLLVAVAVVLRRGRPGPTR